MKFAAIASAVALGACLVGVPSAFARSKAVTPNDLACVGAYNFCTAQCDINHPIGQDTAWSRCMEVCAAERVICNINGDLADRRSVRNPAVSLTDGGSDSGGSSGDGGSGGGSSGGGFDPGSVGNTGNAGASTDMGDGGIIY